MTFSIPHDELARKRQLFRNLAAAPIEGEQAARSAYSEPDPTTLALESTSVTPYLVNERQSYECACSRSNHLSGPIGHKDERLPSSQPSRAPCKDQRIT